MVPVLEKPHIWTFEDLYSLPEADPHAYEIVDGALVVSPGPTPEHEFVGDALRDALRGA